MIAYIRQLVNDMMKNINLNALVTSDMYAKDVLALVQKRRRDREETIKACGGLKQALEWGAVSDSEFKPLNVCGNISNTLCAILLDNHPPLYRFQYDNRINEKGFIQKVLPLSGALNGRSRQKSYLLRVDCTGHSYVVYILAAQDEGYLFQGNAGDSMKYFTLQDWMNSPKSYNKISIREHRDLLIQINDKIVASGPAKKRIVDTYSIDDDHIKNYKPFKGTNMSFILRELNEKTAKKNILALYRRARMPRPDF